MQRDLELHRKETERVQAELLALKQENAKLKAAASKFLNLQFAFVVLCFLFGFLI